MSQTDDKRVLVAMSGGVDSSVAAMLLREQGYEVVGITMKTWDYESAHSSSRETGCCSLDAIHDARSIAVKANIPHYVLDLRDEFEKKIISNFISEYMAGRTPNPCVLCNRLVKWDDLLRKADTLGCRYIATGHYARVVNENGRWFLRKGADDWKDQTYVLWGLTQDQLSRTLFPVGELHKDEVKKKAAEYGFSRIASKSESYEICFIPDNDYRSFLKHRTEGLSEKISVGNFTNAEGKILGKHQGYPFYTVGQRKGLNVAAGIPLYVKSTDPITNTVVLGEREELYATSLEASSLNMMKYHSFSHLKGITTRIRYKDAGTLSDLEMKNDRLTVKFSGPVFAVAPGQSAVFYEGDDLIGGGIIC